MRPSWSASPLAAALLAVGTAAAAPQAPGFRLTYSVRVLEGAAGGAGERMLATGEVSGPQDTALRIALGTGSASVEALFELVPESDTVTLVGRFFTERRVGETRRGLPLWEADSYRRTARLAWGATATVYPFGALPAKWGSERQVRVEIVVTRQPAGGATRPAESVAVEDSSWHFALDAVVRPRRVRVTLALVRGDAASAPRPLDLVVEAPARPVTLVLGPTEQRALEVGLARPGAPRARRDSVLALDADVVCLRVTIPGSPLPARVRCGRLGNVARRLPLPGGDTLVTTFAWPGVR